MEEPQAVQKEKGTNSNLKWILIIAGGGCALLACILLVIVLAGAFFFPLTSRVVTESTEERAGPPQAAEATVVPQFLGNILIPESTDYPLADGNRMGDPDAPVTLIVYSDFQCVHCMSYWETTEPLIIENYVATGQVYYIYRSFGSYLGPPSGLAAEAAYCAMDQSMFWEYHDILFLNWTGEGEHDFSPNRLQGYADALGLDVSEFTRCLESGKYQYQLEQDVTNAHADDIRGTPSFLVNGELLEGALPYSAFEDEIEEALGGK